jgi:hypothetical protein
MADVVENPYVNTAEPAPPYTHNPPCLSPPKLTNVSVAKLALSYAMRSAENPPRTTRKRLSGLDNIFDAQCIGVGL